MTQAAFAPLLLDRLFDDASQLPPGYLSLADALEGQLHWRRDPRAALAPTPVTVSAVEPIDALEALGLLHA